MNDFESNEKRGTSVDMGEREIFSLFMLSTLLGLSCSKLSGVSIEKVPAIPPKWEHEYFPHAHSDFKQMIALPLRT